MTSAWSPQCQMLQAIFQLLACRYDLIVFEAFLSGIQARKNDRDFPHNCFSIAITARSFSCAQIVTNIERPSHATPLFKSTVIIESYEVSEPFFFCETKRNKNIEQKSKLGLFARDLSVLKENSFGCFHFRQIFSLSLLPRIRDFFHKTRWN